MLDLEAIYSVLPPSLQHLACSLEGWRIKQRRYNAAFSTLLTDCESRTYWDRERLCNFRDQRLAQFVDHCVATVPYYRTKFAELGLESADIRTLDDLQRFPVLTKDIVKEHWRDLQSEAIRRDPCIWVHTSGTTGGGLRFRTTVRALQEQWAVWWRYRRWHGINFDAWCAHFGGRSVVPVTRQNRSYWRYNYPLRQVLFSGYHMSPVTLPKYVAELCRLRPPWLVGYPSLLALLAAYCVERKVTVGYQPRWVTTISENLTSHQAELIRKAFGVKPRQHYGLSEAVANFSECENGNLHVDEDFAAVRFVPDPTGLSQRVIGTNFSNLATPLLNYDTGDVATLDEQKCGCGRSGRIVRSVDGRNEDYVVFPDGTAIGRLDHVFKDLINIREAQIYQASHGEIVVRVVPGSAYSTVDETQLMIEMRKRLGNNILIKIAYVDRVERSARGKLRFVVSDVARERLVSSAREQSQNFRSRVFSLMSREDR